MQYRLNRTVYWRHPTTQFTKRFVKLSKTTKPRAAKDDRPPDDWDDSQNPLEALLAKNPELVTFLKTLVLFPGITGTAAVTAAFFLPGHIDPFGHLHWSANDAWLGIQLSLPVMLLDALLMLPDYSAPRLEKQVRTKVPRSLAERLGKIPVAASDDSLNPVDLDSSFDENGLEYVEIERTVQVTSPQHPLRVALHRLSLEKALSNLGRHISPPMEFLLLLVTHLTEEMLFRAVALTFMVGWTLDRLYEAGAEDSVYSVATPQLAAILAALFCASIDVAQLARRTLAPVVAMEKASEKWKESIKDETARNLKNKNIADAVVNGMRESLLAGAKWTTAVQASRAIAEWAAFSTGFLLTGNLLSSYVGAVVSDMLFSYYQRRRIPLLEEKQQVAMEKFSKMSSALKQAQDSRKNRLEPSRSGNTVVVGLRWQDSFNAVQDFLTKNGRLPENTGIAGEERVLANWIDDQRQNKDLLRRDFPERFEQLNDASWWSWNSSAVYHNHDD